MTILAYHSISNFEHPLAIAPERFASHLDYMSDFEVITLEEHIQRARGGKSTRGLFALTFDDGYADFADHALPLLRARGLPATLFLPVGLIGGTFSVTRVPGCDDTEWPLLDWERVVEVSRDSVSVGSHTMTHPILTELDDERLHFELTESLKQLRERVGAPSTTFCYPAGRYDDRVIRAVMEAGYEHAVVTPRTLRFKEGPYTLRRVGAYHKDTVARLRWMGSAAGSFILYLQRLKGSVHS